MQNDQVNPLLFRYDLISCHECGVLHRHRTVAARALARCTRCKSVLYRGTAADRGRAGLNRMAAITMATLFTFLIAQLFPIVELELNGLTTSATLLGAIRILWSQGMQLVATMVFLFTVLLPALELGALLIVITGLYHQRRVAGFHQLLRLARAARKWGMTEVLMIGILITVVKMTSLAQVLVQPGLFGFAVLTLLLAVVVRIEPQALWNLGDQVEPLPPPLTVTLPVLQDLAADQKNLLTCHVCELVNLPDTADGHSRSASRPDCQRCGSTLHRRHPDSINRTWALLIAAAILYIPANLLPVMHSRTLFGSQEDTILSGVALFWNSNSKVLATIIFIASIVVPIAKLGALAVLAATAQRQSRWRPQQRTVLYRMIEFVGRWSMLDIFVVTLTVALVRFQSLAQITAGPGALAFGAVVVLTMMASMQFDPRLIWDPIDSSGEKHV